METLSSSQSELSDQFVELCQMKSEMMYHQHEESSQNQTLEERVKYFLDYNVEDSDVSDCVDFKVNKSRLSEFVEIMKGNGIKSDEYLDWDDKLNKVPEEMPYFKCLDMWYHDRLEYFCLQLRNSSESTYWIFPEITYEQMKSLLIDGFNRQIIKDIVHPCWKF